MDNLTHTLIGVTAANAGLRRRFGPGTTLALVIASNIPDIDIAGVLFSDAPTHFYRRMLTHSLFVLPVFSFALGALYRRFRPSLSFAACWFLFAVGMGLHLLFDLVNSYGIVLLFPVNLFRFELASIFIIDLALWALMLAPLLLSRIPSRAMELTRLSRIAAALVILYVGGCVSARAVTTWTFERFQIQVGLRPSFSYVFPEPFGPLRFRAVLRQEDIYRVFQFNLARRDFRQFAEVRTQDHLPEARRVLASETGQKLMWFFKAPVIRQVPTEPGAPRRWVMYDLRFGSTVLNRPNVFRYGFEVTDADVRFLGKVE